jgi:hypothetical protein
MCVTSLRIRLRPKNMSLLLMSHGILVIGKAPRPNTFWLKRWAVDSIIVFVVVGVFV